MRTRSLMFVVCLSICVLGLSLVGCGGGGGDSSAPALRGGIYKVEITYDNNAAFQGRNFPGVGTYRKVLGTAYGTLDPNDPRNQIITDLALAEKNAEGLVEYAAKFVILTPTDPSKGGKVLFEAANRGGLQFNTFNGSSGSYPTIGNDNAHGGTTTATYPGFIYNMGYTFMSVAWDDEDQGTASPSTLGVKLPIAKNPDGSTITGPAYEWFTGGSECLATYYQPATTDTWDTTVTIRETLTDRPAIVSPATYSWGGGTCASNAIRQNSGANWPSNTIIELVYTAKNPSVASVGIAAMRDAVEFFRYAAKDSEGNLNPVAGKLQQIVVWTNSQPGRLMNDFVYLGFNEDSQRRKVFDGTMNYIGGGDGIGINYRFAQVGRTLRARQNHIAQLENVFPFSYTTTTDPFTGKTDGRNVRCTATNTCPKVMNIYSANEMWVKGGSLAYTDPGTGLNVSEPANVRNYVIAGAPHGSGSNPAAAITSTSSNQFPQTSADGMPAYRALWMRMDEWINGGTPPASRTPSIGDGTAAFVPTDNAVINVLGIGMVPMASLGFPAMSDNLFMTPSKSIVVTVHPYLNFGSRYDKGILDIVPGRPTGYYYKNSVSKVDDTGNEIGGLRMPEVVAPIGSNCGWTLRAPGNGGKLEGTDGSDSNGAFIPLSVTKAGADAIGDGRKSLEERYGTVGTGQSLADLKDLWLVEYLDAADMLLADGFLLPNDHANYVTIGKAARTINANYFYPNMPVFTWPVIP